MGEGEAGVENTTVVEGHPDTGAPITFSLGRGTLSGFEARCKSLMLMSARRNRRG
jgi:hypothetical protein